MYGKLKIALVCKTVLCLLSQLETHSYERYICTYTASIQNMKLIKVTLSLKFEIKEKYTFLWFDFLLKVIIKTYISPKTEINSLSDKTN